MIVILVLSPVPPRCCVSPACRHSMRLHALNDGQIVCLAKRCLKKPCVRPLREVVEA